MHLIVYHFSVLLMALKSHNTHAHPNFLQSLESLKSMLSPREIRYSLEKTRIILLINVNMCKISHPITPDSSVEPVGSKILGPGPASLVTLNTSKKFF
jgi:hypothetical protein